MKIALAQINPTVGDFTGNAEKILRMAERAAGKGADLVAYPELAVCGYPPADLLEKEAFLARAGEVVERLAAWTAEPGRPGLLCGTVMTADAGEGKHIRNVAVLLDAGRMVFTQGKRLLPFYDVFDEQRYFEPAAEQRLCEFRGQRLAISSYAASNTASWTTP